ncbi:serine/threonine-protein phosphatase [Streptomyces sp. PSKA54]|uniref:Serine/threonine-protein phosphatase n=1 Tax=Streptomyces himalayensis subsp. aureolus TaxID=2758039 RepID=A0A7W2D3F3_9ACTN|nr:PP2C family protein-serine/threonine phosphatase [Streptomyces himalayensis]MBA4863755.1 serine/threonine-protein phosphatase [Streptomyces himalayensis subsp. aureolus]
MSRRRSPLPGGPDSAAEQLLTLGHLAGEALERVKLQRARVELAAALQRYLLPPELPDRLSGFRVAARYTPARGGLDVGGDWYDAFPLRDGSVAMAIGDVQGHDVEAVAFMGQVRTGLRAIAHTTTDPGEVLEGTNDLLLSMGCGLFATCTFVRFDPRTGELAAARAGHVPIVWATATGRCGVALDDGGLPLGIQCAEQYPVSRRRLTEPCVFVLLTDGVVEGPSCPLERGLEEVMRLVSAGVGTGVDDLAAQVVQVADLTGHSDDAAVLVACYDGLAKGSPQ